MKTVLKILLKKYFFYGLIFVLSLFLFFNIFYSQKISSLFFGLINNDKKSAVLFLEKIREKKFFENQLKYFENFYGEDLKNEVFFKENQRNLKIKKLEQILEKNPQARDILYSLSLIYLEKNDIKKARKYLELVKEIDPEYKKIGNYHY